MAIVSTCIKVVVSLLVVAALLATRFISPNNVSNEACSRDDEMMIGNMDLFYYYYVLPSSSKATLRVHIVMFIYMALLH
jgi:hypothetical protein